MKKTIVTFFLVFSTAGWAGGKISDQTNEALCYIPGAAGSDAFMASRTNTRLNHSGVPFIHLDVLKGNLEERVKLLGRRIEELLQNNPNLHCHLMGYSMGGIIERVAVNHLKINHPQRGLIPFSDMVLSQLSVSSPHRGTYLATLAVMGSKLIGDMVGDLSEEGMEKYNSPDSALYSPEKEGIPFYSVRTFINANFESDSLTVRLGYPVLHDFLKSVKHDFRNDGIIPLESQAFGKLLATTHGSHMFFGQGEKSTDDEIYKFYSGYWEFVTGGRPTFPQEQSEIFGTHFRAN